MCSATVGCAWAASTAGRARQISRDAALRIEDSLRRGAGNVGRAAHRAQARRRHPDAGGVVRPGRGVHRGPHPRLPDVGAAHGGSAPRARAPGARRPHRCDARLWPAGRVRLVGGTARRPALDRRRRRNALVLDVKRGTGAFLAKVEQSLELAQTMIALGEDRGCPTVALLTAMDRPLGRACGNALETEEAILALRGEGPADLMEVTYALGVEMLLAAGVEKTSKKARHRLENALGSGLAAEKFERVIEAQGGNPKVVEDASVLPQAQEVEVYNAPRTGVVQRVDPKIIGRAVVAMGGGRLAVDDAVDPTVGFVITVKPGDKIPGGEPIASVFAKDPAGIKLGFEALQQAIVIGDKLAEKPLPLISHRVTKDGVEQLKR